MMLSSEMQHLLRSYAEQYEAKDFLNGDPSWFMHQVQGKENRETIAFVASVLSYGSRKQFLPKIQTILDTAECDVYRWVATGKYRESFHEDNASCFYRLYTYRQMAIFFRSLQLLIERYGSLGEMMRKEGVKTGLEAVQHLCRWFAEQGSGGVVPKDAQSCCKRVCMFLRWMVRRNSPVDLGLWTWLLPDALLIPLDVHVLKESERLGLLPEGSKASAKTAVLLTKTAAQIWPKDPARADFALFGLGVSKER